jgi:hypothetical protein
MKVSIRMIGLATMFFWVFLIAYCVVAVYSFRDIQFEFGDPQTSMIQDDRMLISLPIIIHNRGYSNLGHLNVTTKIADTKDALITEANSFVPVIRRNEEVIMLHNLTIDIPDMLQNHQDLMFVDTDLKIYQAVGMSIAELVPVEALSNSSMAWGAPLYGFALGTPEYALYNTTHIRVSVPVNFENHAFFDVAGNITVRMFSSDDLIIGQGQTAVYVPQHFTFSGIVDLYIANLIPSRNAYFDVTFQSPLFSYGPWVIPLG